MGEGRRVERSFKNRFENPTQYYYRFNDPGEKQATGAWSAKDRYLFLKQVIELGVDYSVVFVGGCEG